MVDHATRFEAYRCALRVEAEGDVQAIRDLHERAFQGSHEAALVDLLRANGGVPLSFVAQLTDGPLTGHVLFSPLIFEEEVAAKHPVAVALSPMSVDPDLQRRRLGSLMFGAARFQLRELGVGIIVTRGPQAYFGRFGFRPAAEFGLSYTGDTEHELLAMGVHPRALDGVSGRVRYRPEFDEV